MAEQKTLLALFQDIEPATNAIDRLRQMGIGDDQMNIISGVPFTEHMLGRPRTWTNVPRLALGGAVGGMGVGIALAFLTPAMYPIEVGGQGLFPVPAAIVVLFEMTMLGMLVSTFLGVFLDSYLPNYRPKEYIAEISDGKIAILFNCPTEDEQAFAEAMNSLGAQSVQPAEAGQL